MGGVVGSGCGWETSSSLGFPQFCSGSAKKQGKSYIFLKNKVRWETSSSRGSPQFCCALQKKIHFSKTKSGGRPLLPMALLSFAALLKKNTFFKNKVWWQTSSSHSSPQFYWSSAKNHGKIPFFLINKVSLQLYALIEFCLGFKNTLGHLGKPDFRTNN